MVNENSADQGIAFDAGFYRLTNPDLAALDDDALLAHYAADGWRALRDPSPFFCIATYLALNTDVAESGVEPLAHFQLSGKAEGRIAHLSAWGDGAGERVTRGELAACRGWIDAAPLRVVQPDWSAVSDEALAAWYVMVGWREGVDPLIGFDAKYYCVRHSDVAKSGINPLLHYVRFGRAEGRRCSPDAVVPLIHDPEVDLAPDIPKPLRRGDVEPPKISDPQALDIHWVIPDFMAGSGGHMTIFRLVRFLELFGHRCTIWIEKPVFNDTPQDAWDVIIKAFQCVQAQVRFVDETLSRTSADVVIAAGWSTAWLVRDLQGFAARMYLVQDHEPEFYPTGAMSYLAKETYSFDLGCICAGPWLETLMRDTYGRWAKGFHLASDDAAYFDAGQRGGNGRFRIVVYARERTERRCVQLALAGLQALAAMRDDFEVHFFGQDDLPFTSAPFAAQSHGVLRDEALAELYNTCDLGICFSATNHSLVPHEMMACGLPVLELDSDSTRAVFPTDIVRLTNPAPDAIAVEIGAMLDAPEMRRHQANAALEWVSAFSWEDSARTVEGAIKAFLGTEFSKPHVARPRDVLFDVVMPTLNGLATLESVLDALRDQRLADRIQIHCIDSSSTDGTTQWLRAQPDVSLTVIDQADFQHGRTRNFGASLGSAPLIGFLTQDATPATSDWATDIIKMMHAVPKAAGVFGRHIAYPDHPAFVREEIARHFADLANHPLILSKHTDLERWERGDQGWRQVLHYYSNNNSAMRRAIWQDFPYPEVDFGEDQLWARDIIEAGLSKVYAPTAAVFHSHDFSPSEAYARAKTESQFFKEHFGYNLDSEIALPLSSSNGVAEILWQRQQGWRDGQIWLC